MGAGQAGLSSAYHLRRAGFAPGEGFVVLDHSPPRRRLAVPLAVPHVRQGARDVRPAGHAADRRRRQPPSSEVIGGYFTRYERTFELGVRRPVDVRAVRADDGGRLRVETSAGLWSARALINATGTWDRPFWPRYPARRPSGASAAHRPVPGPEEFAGLRVVVVGGGASGCSTCWRSPRWRRRRPG
ncbi:NAD(P)-binding domain-containing protein [Streptomyces sp. M19]